MFDPKSEIKGNLAESPLAELLAEAAQAGLSGSFRLASGDSKAIIYLKNGVAVFAVSNLRQHRLVELLVEKGLVTKQQLADCSNFNNDFELAETLKSRDLITRPMLDSVFVEQVRSIVEATLSWNSGTWTFNHLSRAKDSLEYRVDLPQVLIEFGRSMSEAIIVGRFRSFEERFGLREKIPENVGLRPQEAFVLSRLDRTLMPVKAIFTISGVSNTETLKSLYFLWLGNFVVRKGWNSAFSESRILEMINARLSLKKSASEVSHSVLRAPEVTAETPKEVPAKTDSGEAGRNASEEARELKDYLKRIEEAESYYEILDVPVSAKTAEIKAAYFNMAKKYHPDRYHKSTDADVQKSVQEAFTEIARAYDTLKDDSTREVYDFKLRKYLNSTGPASFTPVSSATEDQAEVARTQFEQGFDHIMRDELADATQFLARAVHLAPDNARYHAYYGKALSHDPAQRHAAESEIRMALKLDPNNPGYRIILVEFYIQFNLMKRAEGELQRMLQQFPGNKEATALLDSLSK